MNEYDSNRIFDKVKKINYLKTSNIEEADCYIINTCHIREKATEKVYHDVGRIKKTFKNKKKPILIISGCVAQAEGEILIKKEKYIDAVVGPQSYQNINKIIKNLENKKSEKFKINSTDFDVIKKFDDFNLIKNKDNKVSSFITIQEGCDKFCKFCVVPYTRGPEHSRSLNEILSEVNQLVKNGSKEVTLLGQNVNAYNNSGNKLSDLLYALDDIKDLKRIRYTTSHPKDFSNDLIKAHKNCKKLMPLLHLPVQSGSSKILKAMNRDHSIEDYLDIINKLKEIKPSIQFSSDFIIGYPGETIEDFNRSISLLEKVKFINTYSFIFSPRLGTPASNLKNIDNEILKERLKLFQFTASKIKKNYRKKLLNTISKVLFENKIIKDKNSYFGRDEYYNPIIVKSDKNLIGKTELVKIKNYNLNTLFGETLKNFDQDIHAA